MLRDKFICTASCRSAASHVRAKVRHVSYQDVREPSRETWQEVSHLVWSNAVTDVLVKRGDGRDQSTDHPRLSANTTGCWQHHVRFELRERGRSNWTSMYRDQMRRPMSDVQRRVGVDARVSNIKFMADPPTFSGAVKAKGRCTNDCSTLESADYFDDMSCRPTTNVGSRRHGVHYL